MRPHELAESARIIGFGAVHMLGYRDSGMLGSEANNNPLCFHMAPNDEATGRLVEIIRRERPQVIITYNDDQSMYPHPDHVKVHDISLLAFQRSGDPMWYPEAGPVWQPAKMYYTIWSKSRLVALHEGMLRLRGESPFDEKWLERASHDFRITTRIEIADFYPARTGALLAHATQIDPNEPFWFGLTDGELAEVYPWEDWVLARSIVDGPAPGTLEDDLFAGVRDGLPSIVRLHQPLERLP
jgi:mycothiol S-conjugate amidase